MIVQGECHRVDALEQAQAYRLTMTTQLATTRTGIDLAAGVPLIRS